MSPRERYYKAGIKEALFMLSRGRCYAPKCPQRVLRMIDDDPSINIQIAHIHGLNLGSARFDEEIPVPRLNSFGNLLLLCQAHHGPVDDKSKEWKYPADLLFSWKQDREGDSYDRLSGLDVLGKDDLEDMLVSVVTETKNEILDAIDEVADVSKSTAATLHRLLAETFDRPYLDLDAVALLADSATALRHLPDSAEMLSNAARNLGNLSDSAETLSRAAHVLTNVSDNAGMLQAAAIEFSSAFDSWSPYDIRQVTSDVESASQQLSQAAADINSAAHNSSNGDYGGTVIQQVSDRFRAGLITGAIGVGVIAILITIIIVTQNKGG
jgi:flagellar hook-basal body complex protein FliE